MVSERAARVITGRYHKGDENGWTKHQTSVIFINLESPLWEVEREHKGPVSSEELLPNPDQAITLGSFRASDHEAVCPENTVLVGRFRRGDEGGNTRYKCAPLTTVSQSNLTIDIERPGTWTEAVRESRHGWVVAPGDGVLTGFRHKGEENGPTQYLYATVLVNGRLAEVFDRIVGPEVRESDAGWYHSATENHVMTGRYHNGDENGITKQESGRLRVLVDDFERQSELGVLVNADLKR